MTVEANEQNVGHRWLAHAVTVCWNEMKAVISEWLLVTACVTQSNAPVTWRRNRRQRRKSVIKPSPRLEAKTTSLSASAAVHCARRRIHPHHNACLQRCATTLPQARTTDTHSVFVSVRRPTLLPQPRSRASWCGCHDNEMSPPIADSACAMWTLHRPPTAGKRWEEWGGRVVKWKVEREGGLRVD